MEDYWIFWIFGFCKEISYGSLGRPQEDVSFLFGFSGFLDFEVMSAMVMLDASQPLDVMLASHAG